MIDQAAVETSEAKPLESAKPWLEKLAHYKSTIEEKWRKQREDLDKLYSRDERADSADREYSIFWANIEVLRPAIYARMPVPVVAPRFKGGDAIASHASEMLERCLVTTFEQSDLDGCMREVRDEFLRYGRGTAWARLEMSPDGAERVVFDHITAEDFAHGEARNWREVPWVGRRAWLDKDEGVKRFGDIFSQVPRKKKDQNAAVPSPKDQAPVWEFWCRKTNKVHFVAEDFDTVLDMQDPWLSLTGFWPCPRPTYSTTVPKKLKPVPDIRQYKDQIEEINTYTARIAALSESLRLKGFYPAGQGDLSEAVETAIKSTDDRATLIPISSFASVGPGSFKDSVVWLPVVDVLNLVKGLVELRRVVIEDVYQITGISDIVRGQSDPNETMGAQQIKAQWGSMRIRERQNELARFARDMARISGEIIAENFQPETLVAMSQVKLPTQQQKLEAQAQIQQAQAQQAQMPASPDQPTPAAPPVPPEVDRLLKTPSLEDVVQFLRNDRARGFAIEIEVDSTIQPDEDAEKQRRTEFVTTVGGLVQQAAPLVMQAPQIGPLIGEVLKFAAGGFRAGRPLEAAIDQFTEQLALMAQKAQQPQAPPPPDPKVEGEKLKLQGIKAKTEADVINTQAKMQQTQLDGQLAVAEHEMSMQELAARTVASNANRQAHRMLD